MSLSCHGLFGLFFFALIAYSVSENKKAVKLFPILVGIGSQFFLAILLTQVPVIKDGFFKIAKAIEIIKNATDAGTSFVFGYVGGGEVPFDIKNPSKMFVFAFQALPMIVVVSALSMLLFYWGILPLIVKGFAWGLQKTLRIGGALGVVAAAKVFIGQTEAPLLVRPYLSKFSRSELFTVMVCGMATTSGTVMVLYSMILQNTIPDALGHILTVSIISVPAAITISRIIIPQESKPTSGDLIMPYNFSGSMDAISRGTSDGLMLWANIAGMLIVMLALVALVNSMLGILPNINGEAITLQRIFGLIMFPVAWMMGIPWSEAQVAGNLLGLKAVMNEIVAFVNLSSLPKNTLCEKSNLIMSYSLCGFANFGSIGILIGALSGAAPDRRTDVVQMGFKAMLAGTIATCLSGTVIGLLIDIIG